MMKRTQTLYLLFVSGFCSLVLGSSDFHLIKMSKSYTEAKTYCREMYTDLVTVNNLTVMNTLNTLVSNEVARAWIGLEAGDEWMWHWSWPDQELDFLNWRAEEPQNTSQDACGAMDPNGTWFESECGTSRSFVCHGKGETGHIFVAETKSWRNAQIHCRGLSSDLISIHSSDENEAVQNVSLSQNVWIGLFKDPWKWADGSNSSFRYWKPSQPNYAEGQNCTASIFKDDGKWNDLKCTTRRSFICSGALKSSPTTTIQSMTGPTTNTTTPYTSSSTSSTTTSTPSSNVTNATTTSQLNTTALVSSTSSIGINNTTETAMQPPLTTIVQDGVSASTTLNSTQNTTPNTTENTPQYTPGKMILIQTNMTWIEALSYCREHHIDLIHITTEDIQEEVAEMAKNATSPHVWLGLRYTCDFNFWFWTSSANACYLNWAPGQGPEGRYDCGVTGAIEATGGQQWVGLPETEKLNFICHACAG